MCRIGYLLPIAFLVSSSLAWGATADESLALRLVTQGNGKGAAACMTCHGRDGAGNAQSGFPRLSIQTAAYLDKQLADYKSGTRQNPTMQPIARSLSAQERRAVTRYYAGQSSGPAAKAAGEAVSGPGRRLALRGNWGKNVPACVTCHGPGGRGVGATFPALAGQHASYIKAQLQAWRTGTRHNDPNDLMKSVADRLSDEEIDAVSDYFASLPSRY